MTPLPLVAQVSRGPFEAKGDAQPLSARYASYWLHVGEQIEHVLQEVVIGGLSPQEARQGGIVGEDQAPGRVPTG